MRKLCTSTPFSRKLRVYQAQHKSDTLGQFKPLILYLFLSHNTGVQNLTNTTEKKTPPFNKRPCGNHMLRFCKNPNTCRGA